MHRISISLPFNSLFDVVFSVETFLHAHLQFMSNVEYLGFFRKRGSRKKTTWNITLFFLDRLSWLFSSNTNLVPCISIFIQNLTYFMNDPLIYCLYLFFFFVAVNTFIFYYILFFHSISWPSSLCKKCYFLFNLFYFFDLLYYI